VAFPQAEDFRHLLQISGIFPNDLRIGRTKIFLKNVMSCLFSLFSLSFPLSIGLADGRTGRETRSSDSAKHIEDSTDVEEIQKQKIFREDSKGSDCLAIW
jgi:hypothetical protein